MLKLFLLIFILFLQNTFTFSTSSPTSTLSTPTPTVLDGNATLRECPRHENPSGPKIGIYETHCFPNGTIYKKFVLPKNGCTCESGYFRTGMGCISNFYCSYQFFCRVNEEIGTGYCDRLCVFGVKGLHCSAKPSAVHPRCVCKEGYVRYPPAPFECKSAYRCLY